MPFWRWNQYTAICEFLPQRPSIAPGEKPARSSSTCARSTDGPFTSPLIGTRTGWLSTAAGSSPFHVSAGPFPVANFTSAPPAAGLAPGEPLGAGEPPGAGEAWNDCACCHPVLKRCRSISCRLSASPVTGTATSAGVVGGGVAAVVVGGTVA